MSTASGRWRLRSQELPHFCTLPLTAGEERQGRAKPGEESALVGQREAVVRFVAFGAPAWLPHHCSSIGAAVTAASLAANRQPRRPSFLLR
jgi:hypothetical protein